ncbi:MAG: ribosomal RNA small subunit methyltransferase A [Clostridia bacterium]|nr:ribosomal RNA small subunit methyltransferase A [Clostridia bacterium]
MNLCDIKTVKNLLKRYSTDTKKGFGQNFLINQSIPYDIAKESFNYHTSVCDSACVLEIGPGIGALTSELCQRYDKVVAVEIDKSLIPILSETMADFDNLTIVNDDFLKIELDSFLDEHFGSESVSVCANLPYYITTPIIMKILESGKGRFTSITVMVQKEVADRLCATSRDSEYGAITASINYYGRVSRLFDVAPDNFLPPPNVTSSVIRIELFKECPYFVRDEKTLFEVISGAFAQRRKTLLNSLSSSISWVSKARLAEVIEECGFELTIRGERLSIEELCALANKLYEEKIK